jgi:hypothetical protein
MAVAKENMDGFLTYVANGNADAKAYLEIMARVVYYADDIVDEPLDEIRRQELMARLLWAVFVELPYNRFHVQHGITLAPLLSDVIVQWHKSDEWRRMKTPNYARQVFGFVRRENMDSLVGAVAGIVGGRTHAMAVAELVMDVCHASGETIEDWAKG